MITPNAPHDHPQGTKVVTSVDNTVISVITACHLSQHPYASHVIRELSERV